MRASSSAAWTVWTGATVGATSRRVLLDTNVLVYREDSREPAKRAIARDVLRELARARSGCVSVQALSELAAVLTGKRGGWPEVDADDVVAEVMRDFPVVLVRPRTVELALKGQERFGFSYYDAQIWAAAKLAGATVVLSEDFADGMVADGVRFADPFAEGFDLDALTGVA
jgi:predicted nucleic acid-binding protein